MPKLTAMQMPKVAMWLLIVLRMSWMMLTGLASGGNAAAALCCAQRRVGFIPLICRGIGPVGFWLHAQLTSGLCVLGNDEQPQEL